MNTLEQILDTLKQNPEPMSAGQLAESTGIDRKAIDKGMKELKTSGQIVSPKRCFWTVN